MAISFSLFCGSCGKGMSRYMAYIAQKGGIMTVLLSKGFLIFILLQVILAKYRVACFYENGFYDREERR